MATSEARRLSNKANSAKSTGPSSPSGKLISRENSYKHGLTATVVIPEREAAEVERRFIAFCEELQPSGEVGISLARHAATMAVRMERCVEHETAVLTDRVRQAEADFVPPEGVDVASAAKLRAEAGKRALFDSSKEGCLARKYEAAASRGFFRALKELRQIEKAAKADADEVAEDHYRETLASFSRIEKPEPASASSNRVEALKDLKKRLESELFGDHASLGGGVDVPISIGKRR